MPQAMEQTPVQAQRAERAATAPVRSRRPGQAERAATAPVRNRGLGAEAGDDDAGAEPDAPVGKADDASTAAEAEADAQPAVDAEADATET